MKKFKKQKVKYLEQNKFHFINEVKVIKFKKPLFFIRGFSKISFRHLSK